MTTWKPDPQTYDQALHEIGCLEAQVADLQERLADAHRQIAALTGAQASDMPHNDQGKGQTPQADVPLDPPVGREGD